MLLPKTGAHSKMYDHPSKKGEIVKSQKYVFNDFLDFLIVIPWL